MARLEHYRMENGVKKDRESFGWADWNDGQGPAYEYPKNGSWDEWNRASWEEKRTDGKVIACGAKTTAGRRGIVTIARTPTMNLPPRRPLHGNMHGGGEMKMNFRNTIYSPPVGNTIGQS